MRPLFATPSVRDIPDVKKWWPQIPYDKYIVRFKMHREAYIDISDFFTNHTEYTHLIIVADDLEVPPEQLERLFHTMGYWNLQTVSGYCNLDETNHDTYAIQPLGSQDFTRDHPDTTGGRWYSKNKKPILPTDSPLLQIGHGGFCCQIITRELFDKIHLTGKNNEIVGNFDWNFSRECHELGVPLMVDTRVKLWHRRTEQYSWVAKFKANVELQEHGNAYLIK